MTHRWIGALRRERVDRALGEAAARLHRKNLLAILAGALLAFTLLLRYLLVSRTEVNWDEFGFLHSVYETTHGEQTRVLQTAHGHIFSWLVHVGENELDQILTARLAMFALAVVAALALGYVGKRLVGGSAGLFAAFVYGAFAFVQRHGTAFRYDSIIVPLCLGAAALLLRPGRPKQRATIAGALGAVAMLVSIKSVFLLVPLGLMTALPILARDGRRESLVRLATFVLSGILFSLLFFVLHRLSIHHIDTQAGETVGNAADTAIRFDRPFLKANYLIASMRWDTFKWLLLLAGLVVVGGDVLHRRDLASRIRNLQVLALALPLTTIYFYRNAFPYYYVTILPGASLLAGAVWRRFELMRRRPLLAIGLAAACSLLVARSAWRWYDHNSEDKTLEQRRAIEAVHTIFPEPVPYIDRCGMIASFEKVGPFMSTWGMGKYRRGTNIFPQLLKEKRPRFVLVDSPALKLSRAVRHVPRGYRWRPGDHAQLIANFVHFWGPIWIAGKSLELEAGEARTVEIYVPGRYVLEDGGPLEIDGDLLQPKGTVELAAGKHRLRSTGGGEVILRWGADLRRPGGDWVEELGFESFALGAPK